MSVLKHFYPYGHDRVFVSRPYPKTDLVDSPQSTAGSKVFAIIGNINPSKGHETVLRAIQLCNSVGGEIKLKIGASSPLTKSAGYATTTIFTGFDIEEKHAYTLNHAHLDFCLEYVLPFRNKMK
jgi:glycosyltransferase involved in cell wall biosynthesis